MKHKVVFNNCYGGFGLSDAAITWLEQNAREEIRNFLANKRNEIITSAMSLYGQSIENVMSYSLIYDFNETGIQRHDVDLVRVVEALGSDASGQCSDLWIREIEGNTYRIGEYDGNETVILFSFKFIYKCLI
jgi:hypothetical protein